MLERAQNYSEYISRPLRYILAAGRTGDDLYNASRQLYPLIFQRLEYRRKNLVNSMASSKWSDDCLHNIDPILDRSLLLF